MFFSLHLTASNGTDQLNVLVVSNYNDTVKKLIMDGMAIGFYPEFSTRHDPHVLSGNINPIPIEDNDVLLKFGWVKARDQQMSKIATDFDRTDRLCEEATVLKTCSLCLRLLP